MSVAKRVDNKRPRFGSHRPHRGGWFALALDDLAAPVGRRRRPGNDEDAILVASRYVLGKLNFDRRPRDDDALDGGAHGCLVVDSARARIAKISWRAGAARALQSGVQSA